MRKRATFTLLGLLGAACGGKVDDGDGDGRTTEQLIDEFCADMVRLGCTDLGTEAECGQMGNEAYDEAVADGCGSEFDAVLRCVTSEELICDARQACPSEVTQLDECQSEASGGSGSGGEDTSGCGVFYGPGTDSVSCGVTCPTYASRCSGPSQFGPLECSCTEGPNFGATFAASDCSRGVIDSTDATCR